MMRILCGLDSAYDGSVSISVPQSSAAAAAAAATATAAASTQEAAGGGGGGGGTAAVAAEDAYLHAYEEAMKARVVGWCPQNDPIFENLTVTEHVGEFS